ncbi:MAG: RNA methyltransferase [Bacteroidetes bacterium]|jgi:tRNA (guanosine-2'-O-)-methyltransferase|nr:RNA methyltransferase [Bacteroidota bacterium]
MNQTANGMQTKVLLNFLLEYITPERKAKFDKVLSNRTRHITIVLEDIFQPHNASAVLRSCDLTGIQDVHIIENQYEYDINPDVVVGSTKWLNLHKYNSTKFNTPDAYESLRKKGYRIVATSPHESGYTPENLPLDQPVALVFGTEKTGLSEQALAQADAFVRIPMVGFTESYNISVSAALLLYTLTNRLRLKDFSWPLTETERDELMLQWCRNTIKRVGVLEETFWKRLA